MNERIHFFIKIYLSHFILERVMFLVCERWVETRMDCYFDPSSSSTIAALLSHLSWVAQPWVTEGCKVLSLQAGSHAGILSPTDSNHPGHLVILLSHTHLLPLFFHLFTQVHLLIDSSVEGQYITTELSSKSIYQQIRATLTVLKKVWSDPEVRWKRMLND